jgi:phosphoglycerate kinase
MKTLNDFELGGKRILIRVDLNASIINGKVQSSLRFSEHAKTIKELSSKRAKVVILAHQGKLGGRDYLESLEEHSKILSRLIGRRVKYVDDLFGKKAIEEISEMKEGEVILLKNVRSWKGETENLSAVKHSRGMLVQGLKNYFDLFVQDALSVCHRSHASIVGFVKVLPCCAGRVLENELGSIENIDGKIKKPFVLILGGRKTEDYLQVMKKYVDSGKVESILTTGFLSLLGCISSGVDFGFKNKALGDELKLISKLKRFESKFILPKDFAVSVESKRKELKLGEFPSKYDVLDIGNETIKEYAKIIKNAKTIFVKGSAGNYEKRGFEKGTKMILEEVGKNNGFSLVGGGDTLTAVEKYKIKGISHTSLSGGALLKYLGGEKLPGLEVLK